MKKLILAAATVMIASTGVAMAGPVKSYGYHKHSVGKVTASERAAIARSAANLNALKWRASRDGRITVFERVQILLLGGQRRQQDGGTSAGAPPVRVGHPARRVDRTAARRHDPVRDELRTGGRRAGPPSPGDRPAAGERDPEPHRRRASARR